MGSVRELGGARTPGQSRLLAVEEEQGLWGEREIEAAHQLGRGQRLRGQTTAAQPGSAGY